MSTHPSLPQSEDHPPHSPGNPRAEAKAAKAYAKAMRPWYKKKRVIIPAGLVALTMVGSAASSSNSGNTSASSGDIAATNVSDQGASDGNSASKAKKSGGDGKSVTVGQAVTNAGTTYKVASARTTDTIGDPDMCGERADGTFVIANLELTNNKDETKTFTDANAKLKTSDGKEYKTSDKAVLAFGDDSLMLKDIQPTSPPMASSRSTFRRAS